MFSLPLIGGIFTADTLIKRKIEQAGEAELPKSFARGKVTICRSHNKGMMMNTGDKKPAMVKGITSLGFAGLIAWKPLRNVVFNISDFCIFIGSFLILIGAFFFPES